MSEKIIEYGHAKINLYLDVISKYENGYHEVNTVMQALSLADIVCLTKKESGIDISSDSSDVPCDEKNLAYRAASLFFEKSGTTGGVHIEIEKKIPVAAGLAGGSADAAATLVGLNKLFGMPMTSCELISLGANLGADVPFCMMCGTAFADDKGDRLSVLSPMPDCYIVVARKGEGVSTPWAYGELDRIYGDFKEKRQFSAHPLLDALECGDLHNICKNISNIFESAIIPHRPAVEMIKKELVGAGALASMMSGSGTAVFGIFDNIECAKKCVEKLSLDGSFAALAVPITKKL